MTRRITKKYAQWLRPPRVRGPLTAAEATRALPRIMQRFNSRNEVWVVISDRLPEGACCLLSPRYYAAVSPMHQARTHRTLETGGPHDG